jgi:hypothetical protein
MTFNAEHFDMTDMVKTLKMRRGNNHHTVLVLGSRTGRLFRSEKLYETLKLFGDPSFSDLPRIKQFGECYHLLTRKKLPGFSANDIDDILTEALRDLDIADADICLAEFVRLGLFDIIITTNMDDTIEDALGFVGMKEMHDFEVFSLHTGIGKEKLRFEKKVTCRLIKVFGSLTTREYVIKRSGHLSHNADIRELLAEFLAQDILVVGLDPIWDKEIYQIFRPDGGSFWLISEEPLSEDSALFHLAETRNLKCFSGEEGNYQYFMQRLYELFFGTMPVPVLPNYPIHGSILRELHRLRHEVRALREEILKSQKLL